MMWGGDANTEKGIELEKSIISVMQYSGYAPTGYVMAGLGALEWGRKNGGRVVKAVTERIEFCHPIADQKSESQLES
jgi:hypothetical protein